MEIKSIKGSLCQGEFVEIMDSVVSDHHHGQREDLIGILPTVALHGDSTYMTQLHVFGKKESRDEFQQSDSSQSKTIGFEPGDEVLAQQQELLDKIKAVLKLLNFREERVLVQFCAPYTVGKLLLLTTLNKPYGLGDRELLLYRKESEGNVFVIDKDHVEGSSPPARVFRRGLPEWTPDLTNYNPKDFPQQDCAVRCNLHGYLALPVFNPTTRLSVGVLELLASSKYTSFAYEVQHIQEALKTENLISPQVFDSLALDVFSERRRELYKLHSFLKDVCEIYSLTLAQTWAVSQPSSFVPHDDVLQNSCSSFDTRCFGKVCMSTSGLPYHVRDLGMWTFREASINQHLEKSRGVVGRALSSRGSCFCVDVTKLSETEYPLIHYAQMSGLATCFAISLHSAESNGDYVLEFFLPCIKDGEYIMNLVRTLKQNIEAASGFELSGTSFIQEVGPHMDANMEPDTISTSSNWMADNLTFQTDSSDSESMVSMVKTCDTLTDAGMVEVKVTYNQFIETLQFSIPLTLLDLKNKVAKRFNLDGKELKLKYRDEENDLLLICDDDDLKLALDTSVITIVSG